MKRLLSATALTLLMATPGMARETWAILVGASQYDALDQKYWLKGPANDIALVEQFLETNETMQFSKDHVIVLADGVEGAERPTLAAIRAAFAEIAAKAQPGDFVYLHFSGHGSQAPAADPSKELDGLDELFLPVDIGPWEDAVGHVENALVDDEIGQLIDWVRARGADVWAVFDSCHSGTVTRGAPEADDDETLMRQLPPEALGVPDAALAAAEEDAAAQSRGMPADPREAPEPPMDIAEVPDDQMGGFVAFYAAQTNETTPEKRMPKGKPDRKPQGVFTYTIFETLAEFPGITYRQLGQEVLRRYSVDNLTRTTPMFEGDLDDIVFGGEGSGRVQQWQADVKADAVAVPAGQLHGLAEGERLAVLKSPADATEDAIGYVVVSSLDTFSARAAPDGGLTLQDIPKGAVVRKVAEAVDFTLTIALPEGDSDAAAAMRAAAEALASDDEMAKRVRFVAPGEEADLRLAVMPGSDRPDAIWMLPGSGLVEQDALASTPSISTGDKTVEQLAEAAADNFTRVARALNLMKIGAASTGSKLAVKAELRRARFDPAKEEVDAASRTPLDAANVPRMIPDDVVGARLENTTDVPVDFNILYVGSDYSITWMGNGRLQPGDVLDEDYVLITDETFGRDRMVVVLTPAEGQSAVEDLSFLEQAEVPTTRGSMSEVEAAMREAGFGDTTRGAVSLRKKKAEEDPSKEPLILQFEIDTVPGEG